MWRTDMTTPWGQTNHLNCVMHIVIDISCNLLSNSKELVLTTKSQVEGTADYCMACKSLNDTDRDLIMCNNQIILAIKTYSWPKTHLNV